MSASKVTTYLLKVIFSLISSLLLAGCGSSGSNSEKDPVSPQTAELGTAGFDGSWSAGCFKDSLIGVPEADQPDGYIQRTLTIDSSAKSYSESTLRYKDSQCTEENTDAKVISVSGDIAFDGLTTTRSGLEATIVRYFNNGTSPDYIGLLYRDGDVLYRDQGPGTVIEDKVPDQLILQVPWQLVN